MCPVRPVRLATSCGAVPGRQAAASRCPRTKRRGRPKTRIHLTRAHPTLPRLASHLLATQAAATVVFQAAANRTKGAAGCEDLLDFGRLARRGLRGRCQRWGSRANSRTRRARSAWRAAARIRGLGHVRAVTRRGCAAARRYRWVGGLPTDRGGRSGGLARRGGESFPRTTWRGIIPFGPLVQWAARHPPARNCVTGSSSRWWWRPPPGRRCTWTASRRPSRLLEAPRSNPP